AAAPVAFGVVTMLHGMCGQPENACGFWQEAATERGWLFCPGGNVRCGGNHDWRGTGEEKAQHLDLAEQELRQRFGAAVAEEPGLL
ncbi:MAG: hypothetical protein KC731_20410, partial [Myxococcales bacterium]|nr:hypothetical protein [Myxococcales bacterium]